MKIICLPKILTDKEKKEFDALVNKLCIERKLNKKDNKRFQQLTNTMIQAYRDKAFNHFQTTLNNESEKKINERLIAIDKQYSGYLDTMSWETKRELILNVEYNYIQQCQLEDLKTLYLF